MAAINGDVNLSIVPDWVEGPTNWFINVSDIILKNEWNEWCSVVLTSLKSFALDEVPQQPLVNFDYMHSNKQIIQPQLPLEPPSVSLDTTHEHYSPPLSPSTTIVLPRTHPHESNQRKKTDNSSAFRKRFNKLIKRDKTASKKWATYKNTRICGSVRACIGIHFNFCTELGGKFLDLQREFEALSGYKLGTHRCVCPVYMESLPILHF